MLISIHALREEGDPNACGSYAGANGFQSTPSARRATRRGGCRQSSSKISIHALREEGDTTIAIINIFVIISIHALREEGDCCLSALSQRAYHFNPRPPRGGRQWSHSSRAGTKKFQSTPSARRATAISKDCRACGRISIHALREEGDSKSGEKIHHVCSIIHTCAQFEKELYEGSGEMQNKSC